MEYHKGSVTYKNTQKLSDKLQESNELRLDCCCVVYTVHCEALIAICKQPNTIYTINACIITTNVLMKDLQVSKHVEDT